MSDKKKTDNELAAAMYNDCAIIHRLLANDCTASNDKARCYEDQYIIMMFNRDGNEDVVLTLDVKLNKERVNVLTIEMMGMNGTATNYFRKRCYRPGLWQEHIKILLIDAKQKEHASKQLEAEKQARKFMPINDTDLFPQYAEIEGQP